MTESYKILGKYIKDISCETPDIETYIFVRDRITKYQLGIDIDSKALKNKVTLKKDVHNNVPETIIGDPVRLHQVLVNLIDNA